MKQSYERAFAEIDEILNLMPVQLINKIPINFRNMISAKKSVEYKPNIKEPFEEQELMEETIIILGLIYRDFLCDEEERKKLKAQDAEKAKEIEEELREKYNPDNLFNNKKEEITKQESKLELIVVSEEKWYRRIFNLIKNMFKREKN